MRHFLSCQLHWAALGVGMLVLAGGISVSLLLSQRDNGQAPALGAASSAPGQLQTGVEVPGLPTRNTTGDGVSGGVRAPAHDDKMSDSVEMDAVPTGSGLTGADNAIARDSVEMDATAAGSGLTTADKAIVGDSAKVDIQQGEAAPPRSGPGDVASVQDGAELVVRDASGNIKQRKTAK